LTEEVFPIVCQWRCTNVLNIGYISINCSEKCYNQYHSQCWDYYASFNCVQNEKNLLGMNCLTATCCGKIYEIVWVDKFGIETPKKYILTEIEKTRVGNRKKTKTKKPSKIIRSLSETSGSSIEEKLPVKSLHIATEKATSEKSPLPSPKEEKIKIPYESMTVRTYSKTYASTVRNNNESTKGIDQNVTKVYKQIHYNMVDSLHNSEIVEELLGQNCPESFDPSCKLPQKSKILSLIRENSQSDYSFEGSVGEIGDKIESDSPTKSNTTSPKKSNGNGTPPKKANSNMTPPMKSKENMTPTMKTKEVMTPTMNLKVNLSPPTKSKENMSPPTKSKGIKTSPSGFIFDHGNEIITTNNASKSLIFVPGSKQTENTKNEPETPFPKVNVEQERFGKKESNEGIGFQDKQAQIDVTEISPLAKILFKQVPGYSLPEVDTAVKDILNIVKLEDITIPIFRNMLIEKLEKTNQWVDGVYMSDDDDEGSTLSDVDECLICTELLEHDLQHLEPCGHVFHMVCIRKWVRKESSCPKCRAEVHL